MTVDPTAPREAVLAVCGYSGAGKTTLLEALIPRLVARGLAVAVVKHDAHGVQLDHPGKDSDRFFRAGADVALRAPGEVAMRLRPGVGTELDPILAALGSSHDLVLVEGHKDTALPKLWLLGQAELAPPVGIGRIIDVLEWSNDRLGRAEELAMAAVWEAFRRRPIRAGLLVGGSGRRMGGAKHLRRAGSKALVEVVADAVTGQVAEILVLGAGELPEGLAMLPRLPDSPGLAGPIGGMVAAIRWAPDSCWLIAACDLPLLEPRAVGWLLGQRRPGTWAVMPVAGGSPQPLLALYEPQARHVVEKLAAAGEPPIRLSLHSRTSCPSPPNRLERCWRNVNRPEELAQVCGSESTIDDGDPDADDSRRGGPGR